MLQSQAPVMKNNIPYTYLNFKKFKVSVAAMLIFVEATGLIWFNLMIFLPEILQQKHSGLVVDPSAVYIPCYLHVIDVRCLWLHKTILLFWSMTKTKSTRKQKYSS